MNVIHATTPEWANSGATEIRDAFQSHGHAVAWIPERGPYEHLLDRPDLPGSAILFHHPTTLTEATAVRLREAGASLFLWVWDALEPARAAWWYTSLLPHTHAFFACGAYLLDYWARQGARGEVLRQGVLDIHTESPPADRELPCVWAAMVGAHRAPILDGLTRALGPRLTIRRGGGNEDMVRETCALLQRACCAVAPGSDTEQAHLVDFWSNRVYQILANGALCLHEFTPGLGDFFEDREHLVVWRTAEELAACATYYLAHPVEARRIAENGQRLVLAQHRFRTQAARLVRRIEHLMRKEW